MGRSFFRVLPLMAFNFFLLWMGISYLNSERATPTASVTLGELSSVFMIMSGMGVLVAGALQSQEQRIRELEKQMAGRGSPGGPPTGTEMGK